MGTICPSAMDPVQGLNVLFNYTNEINKENSSLVKTIFVKKPAQFGLALAAVAVSIAALVREIIVAFSCMLLVAAKGVLHIIRLINSNIGQKAYDLLPGWYATKQKIQSVGAKILGTGASIIAALCFWDRGSEWNMVAQKALGNFKENSKILNKSNIPPTPLTTAKPFTPPADTTVPTTTQPISVSQPVTALPAASSVSKSRPLPSVPAKKETKSRLRRSVSQPKPVAIPVPPPAPPSKRTATATVINEKPSVSKAYQKPSTPKEEGMATIVGRAIKKSRYSIVPGTIGPGKGGSKTYRGSLNLSDFNAQLAKMRGLPAPQEDDEQWDETAHDRLVEINEGKIPTENQVIKFIGFTITINSIVNNRVSSFTVE